MPASFNIFNQFKVRMSDGTIDVNTDVHIVALYKTLGGLSDATFSLKSEITSSEVANGNGYLTGGKTLSGISYALSGTNAKFDATDVLWSATGAISSMKAFAIYISGLGELVGWGRISTTSVSLTNTNRLTLQWNASGIYTVS